MVKIAFFERQAQHFIIPSIMVLKYYAHKAIQPYDDKSEKPQKID